MVDSAWLTDKGGRRINEDCIRSSKYKDQQCFILCDGLGGHIGGAEASRLVCDRIGDSFEERGDSADFLATELNMAQQELLALQEKSNDKSGFRTTAVVLIVTGEHIKWAHIGDSRMYHIYDGGRKWECTRDHSVVWMLCSQGEISEQEIRGHSERHKLTKVMGSAWGKKSFELSPVLEREAGHAFALMSDGFWEYVTEQEMLDAYLATADSRSWLNEMEALVRKRADMTTTDNFSAICIRIKG